MLALRELDVFVLWFIYYAVLKCDLIPSLFLSIQYTERRQEILLEVGITQFIKFELRAE